MKKFLALFIILVLAVWHWGLVHYPTIQEKYAMEWLYKKVDTLFLIQPRKAQLLHETLKKLTKKKTTLSLKKQRLLEDLLAYTTQKTFNALYNEDSSTRKFVSNDVSYNNLKYVPTDLVSMKPSNTIQFVDSTEYFVSFRAELPLLQLADFYYSWFNEPLLITSTYRSYQEQERLQHASICKTNANRCAKAWHSEHQSGLAVDIAWLKNERHNWFRAHAYKFWFHQSYQHWAEQDFYQEEDWHRRYVWVEFATHLHETWQTFTQWYFNSNNNPAISS